MAASSMVSPCFLLHETRELTLRFEEGGQIGFESFPRRHYPDRVLGYFLSPTPWSTPVSILKLKHSRPEFANLCRTAAASGKIIPKKKSPCRPTGLTFVKKTIYRRRRIVTTKNPFLKGNRMLPFFSPACVRHLVASRAFLACCLLLLATGPLLAQSTFGSIQGTVRDASDALIQGAQVTLTNTGTTAARTLVTDESGSFNFRNIDVGTYSLAITAPGFEKESLPEVDLTARETRRMDAILKAGAESQTVMVVDNPLPVITTDVSNLAETKTGAELVDLPVAIYSRSTGSTSPISTLTTEAGVQTDDSGELAVAGTTAALLSVTIDGISSVGVEYSGPVNEMFPSFNSIEEIRVSESNNGAEFGGVADITTVSKAGTNKVHGGLFENHENTILNSNDTFALAKPKIIMNDFGATLGGPVHIPHLFNGHDSTFFFISFEGLRLPRETPIVLSVPSMNMRKGNIGYYLDQTYCEPDPTTQCPNGYTVYNPDGSVLTNSVTNTPVTPSAITTKLLNVLMPTPNLGPAGAFANNYQVNFPSPISSNQGDVRLDHTISSRQSVFARFSYKNRQVTTAPSAACTYTYCAEAGSPLQGGYNTPEIDEGMTFAHNFVISPRLLNEFRGGYNAQHTSETQSYSTSNLLSQTGLTVLQPDTQWSESPSDHQRIHVHWCGQPRRTARPDHPGSRQCHLVL
jgi:hypothetical protein